MIRVMVIDESVDVRQTIADFIDQLSGYEGCGYFSGATDAIAELKDHRPDIIISNVLIYGMTGFRLVELLRTAAPSVKIILMSEDKRHALKSLEKGAMGFLQKPITKDKFNKLIQEIS